MSVDIESTSRPAAEAAQAGPKTSVRRTRTGLVAAAIAAPLVLAAAGLSLAQTGPSVISATPTPIAELAPNAAVSVKGQAAEVFGNKIILQDASGRTLADLGRQGEAAGFVAKGETLTVQGRFDKGYLKASALIRSDGRVDALGGGGRPKAGSLDWARDKVGLAARPDIPAITAAVQGAGFTDVRVIGSGPKHVDVAAKDAAGRQHELHVGLDGRIKRARPLG